MNDRLSGNRKVGSFDLSGMAGFHQQALAWAATFPLCTFLDSNQYSEDAFQRYSQLVAVGEEVTIFSRPGYSSFEQLKIWCKTHEDWLFGYLSYDLKNEVEHLQSANHDALQWPEILFFQPQIILEIKGEQLTIHSVLDEPEELFQKIQKHFVVKEQGAIIRPEIRARMPKDDYLRSVEAIRQHIIAGDVYEMNFCQEFFAENYKVDPFLLFQKLNAIAKAPFSAFFIC